MIGKNLSRYLTPVFIISIVMVFPVRTQAWGNKGHQIIARIAMPRLSANARQAVAELLEPGETLENVAGWADQMRKGGPDTRSWHFVPIPLTDKVYSANQHCSRSELCIIQALEEQIKILKNTENDPQTRAAALKYVVHLIGDLHQPFHVTTNTNPPDLNANRVKLTSLTGRLTNLHEVWDSDLVDYGLKRSNKSVADYASYLSKAYGGNSAALTKGSITSWALESHEQAWTAYYSPYDHFMVADQRSWALDRFYYDKNLKTVEMQFVRAGVRLAKTLNDVFVLRPAYKASTGTKKSRDPRV